MGNQRSKMEEKTMRKLLLIGILLFALSGCGQEWLAFQQSEETLCSSQAETLYKQLLKTKPYTDVRMSVGRWQRHPHQWVEVWENGKWWIEDPALGNFNKPEEYKTAHHLSWDFVMQNEYPDVRR
jgi:hypothetical protein